MNGIDPAMFELFREEVRAHANALGASQTGRCSWQTISPMRPALT